MWAKYWNHIYYFTIILCFLPKTLLAGVDSCIECDFLLDGSCLASKYLPLNQASTGTMGWSPVIGHYFSKDNIIGVHFRLDNESLNVLSQGGFGLEVEVVEIGSKHLELDYWNHNLPASTRATIDTRASDNNDNSVNALLIKNPEFLHKDTDYYIWFVFKSAIPENGVLIQPNIVIDIDSDCYEYRIFCYDVLETDICEYFGMETAHYTRFIAYPDGKEGVAWNNKETSYKLQHPSLSKVLGLWYVVGYGGTSSSDGFVDVSSGVNISPSDVVIGQNFNISFKLKEYRNAPKTFEKIALAILRDNDPACPDSLCYDVKIWENVSFSPNQEISFSENTYLYTSRPAGWYRAIVRGKLKDDNWFDFGVVSGSGTTNPKWFSAIKEGSDPSDNPPGSGSGNADIAIETVEVSRAGHDHFDSEVDLTIGDFSKIDMEVKVKNKKSADVYVDIYYYWDDDRDFSYSSSHLVGTDMGVKINGNDNITEHKRDIRLPTEPGKYYYYINVIAPGDDDHSSDSDHDQYGKVTIYAPTFPDLVIPAVSVNDSTLTFSQTFTISATVKNQGNGSSGATTLRYYRSTDSKITTGDTALGTGSISGLSASSTSNQTLPSTAPASEGTYWIGACVDSVSGESNPGNNCSSGVVIDIRKPAPSAPTDLEAKASPPSTINLSWTDTANNEDGFRIDRSLNQTDWAILATPASNVTSYQDTGLIANTTYFYRILSYNSGGNSIWSNIASANTSMSQTDKSFELSPILLLLLKDSFALGDLNKDGVVNISDYSIFASNYGLTNCGNIADLNGDCVVDNLDYTIMHANWTP